MPPDAVRLDLTGKTVHAGFVDCLSQWGFDATVKRSAGGPAAAEDFASETLIATKPDNRKGVTPEYSVATALRFDPDVTDSWRKAGVTIRVAGPESTIISGQSAIVSLADGTPRETVLRANLAQHVAFRSPPGGEYPRALLGVFAHARQTFLDAQHYSRLRSDLSGRRVPFDPALEALSPAIERRQPVVFEADTRDEIHRALDFAAEFQLQPVIAGGRQAWKVIDRLRAERVPVILRIGLTEPNEEREKELTTRVRLERNRIRYEERLNASRLSDAGIKFSIGSLGGSADNFRMATRQWLDAGLNPTSLLTALTVTPAQLMGMERQFGAVRTGLAGNLIVCDGEPFAAKTKLVQVFIDGQRIDYETEEDPASTLAPRERGSRESTRPILEDNFVGPFSLADLATEIESDRKPKLRTQGNVLLRNGTVLTVSRGTLENTDVLIKGGKIAAVGKGLGSVDGVPELDCKDMYVMPGIIDTHSHFAVSGGVNEFSLSVVPETRIRDVVDGDDVQIYRAAAGGVTTARLLHGSANCVGGQDAVIKMKYGMAARQLIIHDAPRGVKFALGENVKRTDGRFPNTRLGVEAVLVRAFTEARDYRKSWDEFHVSRKGGGTTLEPRRDLRLEALADILAGDLRVHCHCYRADEILMLLRVADNFGFKIRSLQHVLEGYKVAPEIAAHGASVSLFSDWWAYKIEAYDAIPFAAALLHQAGATVCLKSDSNELMRHMNQEAAKLVKYGGMSEADALKSITLHAAGQLGLENRIGSIDIGKDADIAVFNGHPLNGYSRCDLTLVDGEIYFQRDKDLRPIPHVMSSPQATAVPLKLDPNLGRSYAVTGATIHPATGPAVRADMLVRDGKIAQIGSFAFSGPAISARGMHIYPGMIDAGTVLGLTELDSARETLDFNEGGDFQPDLRAAVAVNPDSELIPVTRSNGVLAVVTRPTGSMIAGQGALISLAGWVPREMAIVDPVALHVELPSGLPFFASFDPGVAPMGRNLARKQRDDKVRRLKDLFRQALAYDAGRKAGNSAVNPRLDALVPYARGDRPVVITAQREPEIREAIRIADELKLKLILSGATDAWKTVDAIKTANVPVIVGPIMAMPQETEDPYDAPYANPAKLHAAGVRFCIRSDGQSNTRNLPYNAAIAVAHGLPPDAGLRSVTIAPAEILGVADQLGSLEVNKRAHFVITNGDILQPTTQVLGIAIDGRLLSPENKQTRLYDRYRQRLNEVRSGTAPLGTK
ncbi:MAG: amidohydrolase family protein [Gemmataceae bacterium]|nr:amidohydrolase family protein [Gemmataceae bacterium]